MSEYLYSSQYTPPAPILEISLGLPGQNPTVGPLVGLVDTGADATYIPAHILQKINAPFINRGVVKSQWGERRSVKLYAVSLHIGQSKIPVVTVISDTSGDEVVLGRNFLNRWHISLDGPGSLVQLIGEPV